MNRLVLAFDASPWIHWVEQDSEFAPVVSPLMEAVIARLVAAITSVLTLVEVLTGSFRRGDEVRSRRYLNTFEETEGIEVLDVDREIAVGAARLRSRYGLRTPDAIHVATGVAAGASAFITMDRRLSAVREIEVRVLRPAHPRRKG